ncbi:ABC transporter ATP-binding protein [Streptomyces griseoviridis]|uniref:ABC transporter ATP-binding protein n=1 Tax=Streptomyces griseoviridis TaxID=45398 RepID=UPI00344C0C81
MSTPSPAAAPAARTSPLLEARRVTMRFGGLTAVDGVDLTVGRGEIVGLIGPNGAGKTTFCNCLTGLYVPTDGEVRLDGAALPPRPAKVTRAGVARTFQNIRLFANMTVVENVIVGRHTRTTACLLSAIGRGPRYRREERESLSRAQELLDFVDLRGQGNQLARNLSYGAQRRLEIARALASEPKLLLLDEPTAGMNPQETRETEELVHAIRGLGIAVLVIEHDMRFIMSLCDRVAVLVQGSKLIEGPPGDVQADERVVEAYLGAPDDEPPPADRRDQSEHGDHSEHGDQRAHLDQSDEGAEAATRDRNQERTA